MCKYINIGEWAGRIRKRLWVNVVKKGWENLGMGARGGGGISFLYFPSFLFLSTSSKHNLNFLVGAERERGVH